MAAYSAAVRQCRWELEVGNDALVGHTGPKGRVERAGFGGSEGETKMGRKARRLQHKLFFLNFKHDYRFKNQRFEILLS
jgi:hypothetical protein